MKVKTQIDTYCKQLHLSALGSQVQQLADSAAAEGISYLEFAGRLLETEIAHRNQNDMLRKTGLPSYRLCMTYRPMIVPRPKECHLQNFNNSKNLPGWIKTLIWWF
jgi:hypothetical protein